MNRRYADQSNERTSTWHWISWILAGSLAMAFLTGARLRAGSSQDSPVDAYNVIWDSPSLDHHGSMPLGNGDIALNAWMTSQGVLHFYLSKTDAWEDNARLVKIGKVRLEIVPNPIRSETSFRQELKLNEGAIEITAGSGPDARVRLWVDARHPVIHITIESVMPVEATATIDLWRTNRYELAELQISDVMMNPAKPDKKQEPTFVEPDTLFKDQRGRIGWLHHNCKSVGPRILAEIQGLMDFAQPDPLLHRTFGVMIAANKGERLDDRRLRSPSSTSHRFNFYVLSCHPATPEQWLRHMDDTIRQVESQDFRVRDREHLRWWNEFWNRSWIRASATPQAKTAPISIVPSNKHPVVIGMNQEGGNEFVGELGRLSFYAAPLSDSGIAALAQQDRSARAPSKPGLLYSGINVKSHVLDDSKSWSFPDGFSIEAWIKPKKLGASGARLLDKISSGSSDGILLDTYPGNSLRFMCGERMLEQNNALIEGQWTHVAAVADSAACGCKLFINGKLVADSTVPVVRDEAACVSQMYHLQRFITACAGRGAFPIKFNGSLFTVPPGPTESDPDYRRWGPGYWWQNTRLPYISLCASGDFDLQRPLFRMYAEELLPLAKNRTRRYFGHDGAYYPECIYFWGPVFSETYGWRPFEQRTDKLQESGWHKWEWVCGLELSWMMLDYCDHTDDWRFLRRTVLPFTREILQFFEQHYPANDQGKLVMHPSQALETWWHCTNAMPELAGCVAITERLLALPAEFGSAQDRLFWRRLRAKLPPIPCREVDGKRALAPATFYAQKSNIENPELYPVFPFRLFAFNRPHADWALNALAHRWDRGHQGWRQDDIFMAYLGLEEDARQSVVDRARNHDRNERFPAFWGPNYDWTPDQDHGGVLMKTLQSMVLQTDGRRIFLLPAWPKDWNVEFKLHAPHQTLIEGAYRNGRMHLLRVTPERRRGDIEMCQ